MSRTPIPPKGSPAQDVLERLEGFRAADLDWRSGKVWAYMYDPGEESEALIKRAYMAYLSENGLDPTAFPSLVRLENEVIAMAAAHVGGDEQTVGNFTSGGTESIILACKAARDWARSKRPELARSAQRPKIVLPSTAHAAFHKAAHYLDLEVVLVDVDPDTFKADVAAMEAAIDEHAIMIVGSAVSYAHCVIDPIPELAALAKAKGLWMHVDGCMGGFLLPYFRRLGRELPDFDLRVEGVCSMSMDLHKYAFAAKGASVILYKHKSLRRHQIFTCANWTGYSITNATVQSSKSGGPVAAAWAILQHVGDDGYLEISRQVLEATEKVTKFVDEHPDLFQLGSTDMNHVSFSSKRVPIFRLADAVNERGWYVQVQLGYRWQGGESPANIHLVINPANLRWLDALLEDIRACIEEVRDSEPSPLTKTLEQTLAQVDLTNIDDETLRQMMAMVGITPGSGSVPKVGAEINEVLDMLEPAARERVFTEFMNELFV
ncbi:aspartate aminotransferase family protein [Pseudenhygromyxa sp. WMMC2535]|uniref:pyridoxal phosphate-dependent decarboxylase family protein n=1 Tax=Pseudenhygromyxa sp. WMMC2535 TaxID=2712867 RepID=UPI001553DE30|nr:aspartate aminotransferase family protein [Pseudenhygromyxa sp. WMMC2535]NVB38939.1 aspartate aminotransferase family protein [Pseudenhygromyxa sp. WMMC2535]